MDKKMKQRILGVALVTLVLMAVLPELVKRPAEPDGLSATVEMPLPSSPAAASFAAPESTRDVYRSATADADRDAAGPATQTLVLTDPNAPLTAPQTPVAESLDGATELAVADAESAAGQLVDQTANQRAAQTAREQRDGQAVAMITLGETASDAAADSAAADALAAPAQDDPDGAIEETGDDARDAQLAAVKPAAAVAKPPPIKLRSLQQRHAAAPAPLKPPPAPQSRAERDRQWVVQAGAFAVSKNADLLSQKLRARQFPTRLEPTEVNGRTLYLVQIGPFPSRDQGRQAQRRLQQETQLEGEIRLY